MIVVRPCFVVLVMRRLSLGIASASLDAKVLLSERTVVLSSK